MPTPPAFPADATVHPGSEIEWWSLFGTLDDGRSLFASFWRYQGAGFARPGWMASAALTPDSPNRRWVGSWLDTPMVEGARAALGAVLREESDSFLETTHEMLDPARMFRPYQVVESEASTTGPPVVSLGPLRLEIGGDGSWSLRIEAAEETLELRCAEPGEAFGPPGDGRYALAGRRMHGYVQPRASASLRVQRDGREEPGTGEFWLSHHWGPWALFDTAAFYFHPEWQRFALRLDDGCDLLLQLERAPGEGERCAEAGVAWLRDARGQLTEARDLVVEPRGRIESLRTHNLYEYGWRVESAELALDAQLEPRHRNHEVPVFSPHRGVLELPCRVSGQLAGRAVTGAACAESFGSSPDIATFFWGRRKTNLAEELESFLPRAHDPAWLRRVCAVERDLDVSAADLEEAFLEPIWSMMDRGGKGWRSTWLMLCCHHLNAGDEDLDEKLRPFLPIIELLHTGSLIIDDIEDASPLRRGKPTLHTMIGTDLAINVGNLLYFLPQLIVEEAAWLSPSQQAEIYQHIDVSLRRGHIGQGLDLMWSRRDIEASVADFQQSTAQLVEQYRLKSGCQLEAVAKIAGSLTGAPPERVAPLSRYSGDFGVAFQIADDIIDTRGSQQTLGKESGEDFANGKLNLVILHALAHCDAATRQRLVAAMGRGHQASELGLLQRTLDAAGSVAWCVGQAQGLLERSWPELAAGAASEELLVMRAVPRWILAERLRSR